MVNPYAANNTDTNNFFLTLSTETLNMILDSIANNYGITRKGAFEEVITEGSENIMDYVTGPIRPAVHLFYKKFKAGRLVA